MEYDILIISFNYKLSEKHFIGFNKINKNSDVNESLVYYENFNNYIEPFKQKIIEVVGSDNFNPDATKILVGLRNTKTMVGVLYDFLMQIKKENVINVTKKLLNYFYAMEYDNCLEKIQINQDIFFNKKMKKSNYSID